MNCLAHTVRRSDDPHPRVEQIRASAQGEAALSLRVRDIPASVLVAILDDPPGIPESNCWQMARKGTILPEVLSLIYWGSRCLPDGCFAETTPINGFASAVAHRGGMRHLAPLCSAPAIESAVRRTMGLQGEAATVMTSLENLARSGIRPSIVRHGDIFASDSAFEESIRAISPILNSAGLIVSFAASRAQAGMLLRLARDRGLDAYALDDDGGRLDRGLSDILANPLDSIPPGGVWLALVEQQLARQMRAAHDADASFEHPYSEVENCPPFQATASVVVRRTDARYSHEELYRAWSEAIWCGARVHPLGPCRSFYAFHSRPGSLVRLDPPLPANPVTSAEVDLFSVSWLESQGWAENHYRDDGLWRQLESLRAGCVPGGFIGSGGDSLVFAAESAIKLCTKAKAGIGAGQIVEVADRVLAATRHLAVRGLEIYSIVGETFLAYAISCEVCRQNESERPSVGDILDFVEACLSMGVFTADVAANNFMSDGGGRFVFVDHSDYQTYTPALWPVFVERFLANTGFDIGAGETPAGVAQALRRIREMRNEPEK